MQAMEGMSSYLKAKKVCLRLATNYSVAKSSMPFLSLRLAPAQNILGLTDFNMHTLAYGSLLMATVYSFS